MSPDARRKLEDDVRVPRASGDEPFDKIAVSAGVACSPRERG